MTEQTELQRKVITDEQIIETYFRREEKAIEMTSHKYGQFLYRIAYNILHDPCDSEECRNDTYLGVWNAIPPTRPAVFPAFITQIIRRIAINRYKEKTRKKRVPSELTVSMEELNDTLRSDETMEAHGAEEIGKMISDYVRTLSDRQQFVFVGRFYMAESVECIARDLGVAASVIYKELNKIKKGLKLYLERSGVYI